MQNDKQGLKIFQVVVKYFLPLLDKTLKIGHFAIRC